MLGTIFGRMKWPLSAMGIDVRSMKLLAFVLGAALAGIAGSIYATKMMIISPESFTFWESIVLLTIVVLGAWGPSPASSSAAPS